MTALTGRPAPLPALTGLRALAALLVVGVHFGQPLPLPPVLHGILARGGLAVSLFFVLSGFVLAYTGRAPSGGLRTSARAFWGARLARLYPLYLCGLALALAAPDPYWVRATPLATVLSLVLLQSWVPGQQQIVNAPGWTLSVEAFFYLLLPVLLPRATRLRGSERLAWGVALWLAQAALMAGVGRLWPQAAFYVPLLRLPEFACGVLLGAQWGERGAPGVRALPHWAADLLVLGTLTLAFVALPAAPLLATNGAVLLPLWAVLLSTLAVGRGRCAWLLSRRPVVLLGEASYALYILHVVLWHRLTQALRLPAAGALHSVPYALLYLALSVACAYLAWRLIEVPARRCLTAAGSAARSAQACPSPGR